MVTTTGGIKLASCRSSLSRSLRAAVIDFRLYINYLYSTATSSFPGVFSTVRIIGSLPPRSMTMAALTGEFSEVEHKGVAVLYFVFGKYKL